MTDAVKVDKFTAVNELAKRRGFFWNSYEIYGGVGGFVTYGPLGTRLKQNIENKLRELFVKQTGIFEMESSAITPGKVFEASGHVDHFKEPMVECVKCNKRFRADHLLEEYAKITSAEAEKMSLNEIQAALEKNGVTCPDCGGTFNTPQQFLTMFDNHNRTLRWRNRLRQTRSCAGNIRGIQPLIRHGTGETSLRRNPNRPRFEKRNFA